MSIKNIVSNKEKTTLQNHLKHLGTHKKHLLARCFLLCFLADQTISKKKNTHQTMKKSV